MKLRVRQVKVPIINDSVKKTILLNIADGLNNFELTLFASGRKRSDIIKLNTKLKLTVTKLTLKFI